MLSMTGFGKARGESDRLTIEVEIRSVNNRFLKSQVKCPAQLKPLESTIDQALRKRLARGSVTVTMRLTETSNQTSLTLNGEVAKMLLQETSELAQHLGMPSPTLSDILRLPGVVSVSESTDSLSDEEIVLIHKAVSDALDDLIAMRATEGAALKQDLSGYLGELNGFVSKIASLAPAMSSSYGEKLKQRIEDRLREMGDASDITSADIIKEVALFTDRTDISEELQRLTGHMDQVKETLALEGEIGRRLDFLIQEVHREINTIGSKAQDMEISRMVVECKTTAEKLREQVQNAE